MSNLSEYPIQLTALNKDPYGEPLVCSGCGHSAADAPFPGHPSGERPCFFCVRNVQREQWCAEHLKECDGTYVIDEAEPGKLQTTGMCCHPAHGKWYNGSDAMKVPMDCYQSSDMNRQSHLWQGGNERDVLLG